MRFPLFRSRAFWFGMPTLLFLLWAWVDSTRNITEIGRESPWGSFAVDHWNSAIVLSRAPVGSPFNFSNTLWRGPYATKDPAPAVWWPAAKAERDPVGRPFVRIPHWLLVLAYLAAWSMIVTFRRRHWMKAHRTPGPIS